jgi:hypothetical protein
LMIQILHNITILPTAEFLAETARWEIERE